MYIVKKTMFEGDKKSPILDYTNQELSDYIILDESGEVVKDSCYEDKIRDLIVSNILEKDYKGEESDVNISSTSTGSSPKVRILRRLRNRVIYDIEEGEDNKETDIMSKDIMKDVIDELVMYVRNKSAIKFQSLARTYLAKKKADDIGETDELVNDIVEEDKGGGQVEHTDVNLLISEDYVWQPDIGEEAKIEDNGEVEKLKDMCVVEKPDVNEDIDKETLLNNCPGGHTLVYFEEKDPIFICDMCDEYCYGVFFGFRECDYDVCEKCQSWGFDDNEEDYYCGYSNIHEELEEPEKMYINCPQGHTLYELNATDNKNKYYCDLCNKYNKDGLVFYGCDSCNWDVCVNCVPDWKKRVVNLDTETKVDKEKVFWESTGLFSGLALTIGVGMAAVGSAVSSVFNRSRHCQVYSTLDERDTRE